MQLVRRGTTTGLAVMALVAMMTAIWPIVAEVVSVLLVTVVGAGAAAPVVLVVRWVRRERAWRRELHTAPMPIPSGVAARPSLLVELRESA